VRIPVRVAREWEVQTKGWNPDKVSAFRLSESKAIEVFVITNVYGRRLPSEYESSEAKP
jgi:hypothetical protein